MELTYLATIATMFWTTMVYVQRLLLEASCAAGKSTASILMAMSSILIVGHANVMILLMTAIKNKGNR
jgi:hypothetical protein